MIAFELPDEPLAPVTLAPETRVTLGADGAAPDAVRDRISIGRPVCVALDPVSLDEAARPFLAGRAGSTYWLLALTCSFLADAEQPIEQAWLEVALETTAPDGATEPVAWSMEPLALTHPIEISRVAKLDASLKLASDALPLQLGPAASRETTESLTKLAPYVEAHREGTARPTWFFIPTPVTDVRGVHRLRMVVELPAGARGRGLISSGATLRLKRLGLIPYRARLEDLPEHRSVTLG